MTLPEYGASYRPKDESASLRALTTVALIYSIAIAAFYWLVPGDWEGSTPIKAVFGDDLLTPVLLYFLLVFSAPVLDIVVIALTLRMVAKTKRKPNLIIGAIALVIGLSPVVDTVYSYTALT